MAEVRNVVLVTKGVEHLPGVIASLSNLGGGLVCESVGVVPIDKAQLKQEAKENL